MNSGLAFWMPFIVIFGAALIISVIQRYSRDIVLMHFHGDRVLIRLKNGQWMWGCLKVHAKALELIYETPAPSADGSQHLSRILYEQNVADISVILRPEPAPDTARFEQWQREIHRLQHPSLFRRIRRRLRNFFQMLRNAFSESIAAAIGIVKQRTALGKMPGVDQKATEVGQRLITSVPASYEPILEHYLTREVAVESMPEPAPPGASTIKRVGIFEEYSDKFILLRDVAARPENMPLDALGENDAADRFAVIVPRSTSFVRHLARRDARLSRPLKPASIPELASR